MISLQHNKKPVFDKDDGRPHILDLPMEALTEDDELRVANFYAMNLKRFGTFLVLVSKVDSLRASGQLSIESPRLMTNGEKLSIAEAGAKLFGS